MNIKNSIYKLHYIHFNDKILSIKKKTLYILILISIHGHCIYGVSWKSIILSAFFKKSTPSR